MGSLSMDGLFTGSLFMGSLFMGSLFTMRFGYVTAYCC